MKRSKTAVAVAVMIFVMSPVAVYAWVTHSNNVPASTGSDPAYNAANPLSAAFNDKAFGTKIVRVSGNSGDKILLNGTSNSGEEWPNRTCHQYSSNDNAWNADGSLLLLHGCQNRWGILLDGNTFKVIRAGDVGGARIWNRNDPNKMYVISGNTVREEDPRTGNGTTIMTLSGYSGLSVYFDRLSTDGKWTAVTADKGGKKVMFGINLAARTKGVDIPVPDLNRGKSALMSASGKYLIAILAGGTNQNIYDVETGKLVNTYRGDITTKHSDIYLMNGRDYWIFIASGGGKTGQVWRRDILTNQEYTYMDFGVGNHVSMRSVKDGRYAIVSYDSSRSPMPHEVVAVRIDGDHRNVFRRLFKHNSILLDEYSNESHPNPSPDGKKIVFASNWGDGGTNTYVALLSDWDTPGGGTTGGTTSGGTTGGPVTGPCNLFQSGQAAPDGYGVAWNTARADKPLLLNSNCQTSSVELRIGHGTGEQNHYVYKQGYVYTGGAWQPKTFSGSFVQGSTDWLSGDGTHTYQNPPSGQTFWVGYLCQWIGSQWNCGCRDAACSTNYWQLQGVVR